MTKSTSARKPVYYANRISIVFMVIGVAGIVLGAITRDNAPIPLIAVMVLIGVVGIIIYFISKALWSGMDVADAIKERKNK